MLLREIKRQVRLVLNYYYDWRVYSMYNGSGKLQDESLQLLGKIVAHYHVLEKGMSHANPKEGFSKPVAINLLRLLKKYREVADSFDSQYFEAVQVLLRYIQFPTIFNHVSKEFKAEIEIMADIVDRKKGESHSRIEFTEAEYFKHRNSSFDDFALSRYSVRAFRDKRVDQEEIRRAVEIALKAPSVCNRQTSRVTVLHSQESIDRVLALQNGNRGFGEKIRCLLLVTSEMAYFEGARERNQFFVDGGIFLMALLFSLHYQGLGAVTLNWAYDYRQDRAFHKLGLVGRSEKVIALVGVGYVPNKFAVAKSSRRHANEILRNA